MRPNETRKSSERTRPKRRPGTHSRSMVDHSTPPYSNATPVSTATSTAQARCRGSAMAPNASEPMPHARNMALIRRRGLPNCETTRAARIPPAPGRDDGAVGVGPRPEAVADDERHQDVEWGVGEQEGECGHDQRDPDPGLRAGIAVPLADFVEDPGTGTAGRAARLHRQQGGDADAERQRVERKCPCRADP